MEQGTRIQYRYDSTGETKRGVFIRKVKHREHVPYESYRPIQQAVVQFDDKPNQTMVTMRDLKLEEPMPEKPKKADKPERKKRRGKCLCPTCGAIRYKEDQETMIDYIFSGAGDRMERAAIWRYLKFQRVLNVFVRAEKREE